MDIKKLIPWNWFKKEDESSRLPIHRVNYAGNVSPIAQLHDEMDRVFDSMLQNFAWPSHFSRFPSMGFNGGAALLRPQVDVSSSDDMHTIKVEVPGVKQEDINLEVANGTLTISGEKKQESEEKHKHYYHMERSYGSFQRVLSLPEDVDESAIKASFANGVLTIDLPRKGLPKAEVKQIAIN
jgi:HSP20 family protein